MIDKIRVYMCLHITLIKSTAVEKLGFFNLFLFSTSWIVIPTKLFRKDYVAACRTACCSATEKNEMSGYGNFP